MDNPNAPASANPLDQLDQFDPDKVGTLPMPAAQPASSQPSAPPQENEAHAQARKDLDRLDPFPGEGIGAPETSTLGAFTAHAATSALPAAGGLIAAGAGATAGAEAGALLGPWGAAGGGLIGGLVGFFGGSAATEVGQDYALSKAPDAWKEKIGLDDRSRALQEQQHPYASFIGGFTPYAVTMRPGALSLKAAKLPENATALQRIAANPVTSRVFGAGAMGGLEFAQEEWTQGTPDWAKVAIATGFGLIWNKPTRIGEALSEYGARPVRAGVGYFGSPTIAQAGDAKVAGPGITEDVHQGQEQQSEHSAMAAQQAARDEEAVLNPQPEVPDIHALARTMHPELFEQYDALQEQAQTFRNWIEEYNNPSDETMGAAEARRDELQRQLDEHIEERGGYKSGPEARRLRAQIRDAQGQIDMLTGRREAWQAGTAEETPERAAVRAHLMAANDAIAGMAPHIAAAYRRAAERSGAETVEPPAAAAPAIATGRPQVDAVLANPVVAEAIANPKIDRSGSVPYEAGASKGTDPTTHLDKHLPDEAHLPSGGMFDPAIPANIHEQVEKHVMESLIARFKAEHGRAPNEAEMNRIYEIAHHEYAEPAEDAWYKSKGLNIDEVNAWWKEQGKTTEAEGKPSDAPADLYPKPYPHDVVEGAPHEESGVAAEWPTKTDAERAGESGTSPERSIAQQRAFIVNHRMQQLIAAGRPADEAQAGAHLTAERYVARAAAFEGKRGTAQELYEREGADIRGPGGKPPRARVEPAPTPVREAEKEHGVSSEEPAETIPVGAEGPAIVDPPPEPVVAPVTAEGQRVTYAEADAAHRTAFAKFQPIREAFRAGKMTYEEFGAAQAEYNEALKAFDAGYPYPDEEASQQADLSHQLELLPTELTPISEVAPPAVVKEPEHGQIGESGGQGVQPAAPEVPGGEQPQSAEAAKPIRKPRPVSARGRGKRGADVREGDAQGVAGDAEPAVPRAAAEVTKPPPIAGGDHQARPDLPAPPRGRAEAVRRIEERSRSNYRITDDDLVGAGSPKEKIKANIEAIRTLKAIEEEGREATPAEKAVLVKYTGWGAFAQDMFADYRAKYPEERAAFRAIATDEEFAAAKASTLNAHYTSPDVVRGMWDAILHLGYDGGLALEPASGVGHFIGLIPDGVAHKTAWTATELDPLTGRIAKALYGGAEINVQGFETLKRPSNYYDLAISNVPFGNFNLREKAYGSYPIHDFFFVKSLDKVRPGGVVAFVTSRYSMDRVDAATRREWAKSADLVGAIRLPGGDKGAFASNAGTEVTTDIIFLRKRIPGEAEFPSPKWTDLKEIATPEGPVKINEYFADNPKMMLGEMRLQGSQYRAGEPMLIGDPAGLRAKIAEAASNMPADALTKRVMAVPERVASDEIGGNVKEGGFFVKDGQVYRRMEGQGVVHEGSAGDVDRITRLVGIRDIYNDLLAAQLRKATPETTERLREALRDEYDAFVAKHGPINKETRTVTTRLNKEGEPVTIVKHPNLDGFRRDPDAFKVAAIENYDAETGKATRATAQTKDVIAPPTERKINGPSDAMAAVLDEKGAIDLNRIGELMGAKTEDEVVSRLGDLIFHNPDGRAWEPSDKYLSGDVVRKLEEARAIAASDPAYLRNVAALEKVQPTPLTASDIVAQFGAPWIPDDVYADFVTEIGGYRVEVRRVPITGEIKIAAGGYSPDAQAKYGTDRVRVGDVVEAALRNGKITVWDRVSDTERVVNGDATEAAGIKVKELREAFTGDAEAGVDGWIFGEDERSRRLEEIYNRTFNNLAQRKFDGSHLTFPGMSADLSLRPHQKDAVWRVIQNGNTLLAHVVGAGKTYTMIAAGMEQRRLGLVNKPAYVVPNHMLEQFSREFLQAYPDAKILVASKDEMTRDQRKAFVAKIAANDWDGVVITHDAFGRIGMSQERRADFIREQMDQMERARKAEAQEAGDTSPTVKELERARKRLQGRLDKLLNEERKDEGTSFEETGIDHLFVDEAHKFKNLAFATRLQRIKGLAQGDAQRAEDLFMKTRFLDEKRPQRAAVFATGTPVSNTMAEIWTMMRYLELDKLKERGLENFDAWANTFGKITSNMELGADARSFKEVSSFSKFVNVPELISLYSEIADTKTADMLNLPRPKVVTERGTPGIEIIQATPSEQEEAHIEELVKLAESLKGKPPRKGEPNMLSVVTMGRKVATDGRLIDPDKFDFNPQGKIALAVDKIGEIYKKGDGDGPNKAQMVFLDMGVPTSKSRGKARGAMDEDETPDLAAARINLYDDIKQRLVEQGIPAKEIAFIHDAADDAKKAALFQKVRTGEVRVILGSSEKMGVGTNVQNKLIAMHHLDAPWKPADVEQRDGRIVRQGNENPEVQIYRYVTKRSFDAFMWQKLDTKSRFISQVLSGAKGSRHAEDVDSPLPEASEMKAAASGDPRIQEHADLERQVRQYASQKRVFEQTRQRATYELGNAKARVANYEQTLPQVQADAAKVEDISGDKFKATIAGGVMTERRDAGKSILDEVMKLDPRELYRPRTFDAGEISGLKMSLVLQNGYDAGEMYIRATPVLTGASQHMATTAIVVNKATDPMGFMRRFENMLSNIAAQPKRIEELTAADRKSIEGLTKTAAGTWPREQELKAAQQKLTDLNSAIRESQKKPAERIEAQPATELAQGKQLEQSARGGIVLNPTLAPGRDFLGVEGVRPIMTLMKDADASTFIHESGHQFLAEMMRDAEHEAAPDALKGDAETIRGWLGVKASSEIQTRHQEKFARGFEQYMREGVAPSPGLAGVFAKFRSWLLSIYETIKGLGKPINDDIRAVFDRMLATEPQRTVIAPERPGGASFADIHEADAALTEPHEADAGAARIEAETVRQEAEPPVNIAHEVSPAVEKWLEAQREQARAGGEPAASEPGGAGGERAGVEPEVAADRGPTGAKPGGGGVDEGAKPVLDSGGEAGTKGAGVSRRADERGQDANPLAPSPATVFSARDTSPWLDPAGNIRVENLTTSEDVARAIHDAADANDNFIGDRRGKITDGQVEELAEALGMDANMLNRRQLGQAFNAEQVWAARKLLIRSATDLSEIMKKAAAGTDEDLVAYAVAKDRHQMIQAQVSGITAEAGRALRAFRTMTGEEAAMGVDHFIKSATGKTLFQLRTEAKLGAMLDTPQAVSQFMADASKRSFGRMVLEFWINGLISGPITHSTYIVGNSMLTAYMATVETGVAAAIGQVARALGREGPTVRYGEILAAMRGATRGYVPSLKATIDAIETGITTRLPGEDPRKLIFQTFGSTEAGAPAHSAVLDEAAKVQDVIASGYALMRGVRDGFVAGDGLTKAGFRPEYSQLGQIPDINIGGASIPVGSVARLPSRMVGAIHSFFRSTNYAIEINKLAYREAANLGLEGAAFEAKVAELRQAPPEAMMEAARYTSNEATLMGQGEKWIGNLSKWINTPIDLPVFGETPILKFIDPFVHIAGNIIKQSVVMRTPAGILSKEIRADLMGRNGSIAQDTTMARMLAGTALAIAAGTAVGQGYVSGSGPQGKDAQETRNMQAVWRLAGNQPHSVRIGDIWYDMHRLGPLGMLMSIAADMHDMAATAEKGEFAVAASMLHHAIVQNIVDESFMRGPADLIRAVEEPGRYGANYVRNFASSFLPYSVGMSQVARMTDPYMRQARTTVDAIRAKIPGMSEGLLPRRDIWGEPIASREGLGGITSIYASEISADPVNLALANMGIGIGPPERRIRNVPLSDQQYDQYAMYAGRLLKSRLDVFVRSPDWQSWPPHTRHDVIQEAVKQSREAARNYMFMRDPTIPVAAVNAKRVKAGLPAQ